MSAAALTPERIADDAAAPKQLAPGDIVDRRYRIESYLGGGGMASVYRATHVLLETPVAIKVVSPQIRLLAGMAQRFLREARAATRMKGEHVARVSDVGTMPDGAPFMVMEYLEGRDLDAVLESGEEIPVEDAVDYVLQACEALAEVHGIGIVHRDLKPANLFLTRGTDGAPFIKLIDFGISRSDSPLTPRDLADLTQPDALLGSPRYMSPEQMQSTKTADSRSDIYGIGAVLYELLTHRTPHDGDTLLDIYAAATMGPPEVPSSLRSGVPSALDDVIMRCLRIDPDERFEDAAALAKALAPFGPQGSMERAERIARILDSARARANADGGRDARASDPGDGSRVRRRVPSSAHARRQRRLRIGGVVLGLCSLVALGIGAREIYARGLARGAAEAESAALTESAPRVTVGEVPSETAVPVETVAQAAETATPVIPASADAESIDAPAPATGAAAEPVTATPATKPVIRPQPRAARPAPVYTDEERRLFEDRK